MQPLRLDYRRNRSAFSMWGLVVLVIALILGGWLVNDYLGFSEEKESLEAKLAKLRRHDNKRPANSRAAAEESEALKPELKRANEVIRQLILPWDALFKAVEAASFDDVTLLGIQPDVPKRSVSISAEAKDLASMLKYVKRLSQEPVVADAHVINHQIQQQDPQKPVRFTMLAGWVVHYK